MKLLIIICSCFLSLSLGSDVNINNYTYSDGKSTPNIIVIKVGSFGDTTVLQKNEKTGDFVWKEIKRID